VFERAAHIVLWKTTVHPVMAALNKHMVFPQQKVTCGVVQGAEIHDWHYHLECAEQSIKHSLKQFKETDNFLQKRGIEGLL
jgi:hypothetical protein